MPPDLLPVLDSLHLLRGNEALPLVPRKRQPWLYYESPRTVSGNYYFRIKLRFGLRYLSEDKVCSAKPREGSFFEPLPRWLPGNPEHLVLGPREKELETLRSWGFKNFLGPRPPRAPRKESWYSRFSSIKSSGGRRFAKGLLSRPLVKFFLGREPGYPGRFAGYSSRELEYELPRPGEGLFTTLSSLRAQTWLDLCEGDQQWLFQGLAILFLYPGIPCLYAGRGDLDFASDMAVAGSDWSVLINISGSRAVREGALIFLNGGPEILLFLRYHPRETLLFAMGRKEMSFVLPRLSLDFLGRGTFQPLLGFPIQENIVRLGPRRVALYRWNRWNS